MPISMPTGWRESASGSRTVIAVARLYYGPENESDYIAVSTSPIRLDGQDYLPVMESIPSVDYGVDLFTHSAETGNLRLSLINHKISDLLESATLGAGTDIGMENRRCDVRLCTPASTAWSGSLLYYSGIMRLIEDRQESLLIDVQSRDHLAYLQLPRTEINLTDYPNAPQSSLGRPLPITIGSIDYAPGIITDNRADIWTSTWPVARFDNATYATDGLKGFGTVSSTPYNKGPLFTWSGAEFVPARTDTDKRYTNGATQLVDCRIDFTQANINAIAEVYPSAASATWDGANAERVTDGLFALSSSKSSNAPWTQRVTLRINGSEAMLAAKEWSLYAFCRADITTQADATATLKLYDSAGNSVSVLSVPASTFTTFNNMTPVDSYTAKKLGNYRMSGEEAFYYEIDTVKTGAGSYSVTAALFELGLVMLADESDHSKWPWFAKVDGRKDDSGGTYSGTASALIEKPSDAIYQIAANDLGLISIDTAAFAASRTALNGWRHAFSLMKSVDARTLLQSVGSQSKSYFYFGPDGAFRSATIADTYATSDRQINFGTVQQANFTVTALDKIATNVTVRYARNYATDQYEEQTTAGDGTQNARYALSNDQATLEVDADAIRETATAVKLRNYLLRQRKQPHNIFVGLLPMENIDLDIGDIIQFTDVPFLIRGEDITINNSRSGQTIYKYWWIYHIRRSASGIRIKALQLHDLS